MDRGASREEPAISEGRLAEDLPAPYAPRMKEAALAEHKLDFAKYVDAVKRKTYGGEGGARYAYSGDIILLNTLRRIKPLEYAAASIVRMYKDVLKNQLLGTTVKVTPTQFPSLYRIAEDCARTLNVPVPTLYVANNPYLNAYTFGTDEDAFIVLHSSLVDHYDEDELRFVIGHETGHIQNKHVVYGTVLILLKQSAVAFLKFVIPPLDVALNSWFRRAEVTCDRAGLLCCNDYESAMRAFVKLACGSQKLYKEIDINAYVAQADEGREGVGRLAELFATHPYLPKRIEAMRVFAASALYKQAKGDGGEGLSMDEVDKKTSDIIQVVRGKPKKEDGENT